MLDPQSSDGTLAVAPGRAQAPRIGCVVPAYNEATHIAQFLGDLQNALRELSGHYEIIVVNDGSKDGTEQAVLAVATACGVRYLGLSRNFGKEAALSAGIEYAKGDVVILLDVDYQHPLSMLSEMILLWQVGYDMVYGVIADRSHVVTALRQLPERNRFMKGAASPGFRRIKLWFAQSGQIGTIRGHRLHHAAAACVGRGRGLDVGDLDMLCRGGRGRYPVERQCGAGLDHIDGGLDVFSGVQLFSIGILGEYLGRIYEEVKRRPLYLIAEDHDHGRVTPATPDADKDAKAANAAWI